MAALTTDDTLFGAKGVSDPCLFFPHAAFRREIDFSKANALGGTDGPNYSLIPVPKGFVLTGAAVAVLEPCDGTSNTFSLKVKSDSADIGSAVAVTTAGTVGSTASVKAFAADDMVCFKMAAATAKGKVAVTLVGFFVDEETFATAPCPAWRAQMQTTDNVSGGQLDPRTPDIAGEYTAS